MSFNGGGVTVSAAEAVRVAVYLETIVLPMIGEGEEVKLDGTSSSETRYLGSITEVPADRTKLYGASKQWLCQFAAFCRDCGGFHIY